MGLRLLLNDEFCSAGVIDLSCARELLKYGARVTVVAEWMPGDEIDRELPAEFASAW